MDGCEADVVMGRIRVLSSGARIGIGGDWFIMAGPGRFRR
jgi:hypothetical protein